MVLCFEVALNKYLVLGNPIDHSLSPQIHQFFAQESGLVISYGKHLVPPESFNETIDFLVDSGHVGFNITVPFKEDAYKRVDTSDDIASEAQAVNTIRVDGEGQLHGFNTDGIGLTRDLVHRHGISVGNSDILILGAGGATRGVIGPLLDEKPNSLAVTNRSKEKGEDLVHRFSKRYPHSNLYFRDMKELDGSYDLVINATSIGLSGAFDLLGENVVMGKICYDLSYGSGASFATWARSVGAATSVDGLGMLVEQAAESFLIWHGHRPDTDDLYEQLRAKIDD